MVPPVREQVRSRPGGALRSSVAGYTGYRERGVPPTSHRGLPSPWLTLIVTLDDPLVVAAHPDPRQLPSSHRILVGGLHTAAALISHDGRQSGVQVELDPLSARAVFGLPAGELAGRDLEGDQVLGHAAELHARVALAATWPDRFAVLDEFLHPAGSRVPPEVAYAWRRVVGSGGRVRVADLVAETGWSNRHLTARFTVEVGLSPKAACRVVRFDRARRRLAATGPGALAGLAADTGFADQAHLAREFRALAGCPPSQWIAEVGGEVRNVQAPDLAVGAS